MSKITQQSLSIIMNTELLTINQDAVIADSIAPFRWGINVSITSPPFGWRELTM
jgi:alpha-galactosidase